MGKEKDLKMKKQKKKKKDKDNFSSEYVGFNRSDLDGDEPAVLTESGKKSQKKAYLLEHLESPRKKSKLLADSPLPHLSSKKKKRDKEAAYVQEPEVLKKSKKNKELSLHVGSKKGLSEGGSPKKSNKHLENLKLSVKEELDSSDNDEKDEKEVVEKLLDPAASEIITSAKHIEDETGWNKEDFVKLLENMSKVIPEKDNLKYSSRVERLDWSQIKFNEHEAEECKEKWKLVEKKVRGFRILREMVDDAKLWLEKPWSSFYNSNKKNRHPDMPRRPLTSYMLFYVAKKGKFAKKYPSLGLIELSKIIADKFHKLSDSKKQKYIDQAKFLREEFNEKMQKFIDTHPNESMAIKKKLKEDKTKMPGPKRPLPPIKLFIEEKLKNFEGEGVSRAEATAQVKEAWKHLSTKKKVPWIRWAHENEKKYLEELEIYKSENQNFEMPKIKPLLSKEEITILERMEGKPEKPPNSAYSLFSRLMLKDDQIKLMNFSPKDRMKEISRLWAAVSDEEKKQYQEKAKHLLEIYKLEYATYLESLPEDKRAEELAKSLGRKRKNKETVGKDGGKKLKQTKLDETFGIKQQKNAKGKAQSSDDEAGVKPGVDDDEDDESDGQSSDDESDIFKQPQKLKEIKAKLDVLEPPKPSTNAYELFKELYLVKPGAKESKAQALWESMPKKEKDGYKKKLEAQKQSYIVKYKAFLSQLDPHEIKVYSKMKNQTSAPHLSDSSEGEESDDEESSDQSEDERPQASSTAIHHAQDSSSSEETD